MNTSIHRVKRIVKGEIVKNTNDRTGEIYYYMPLTIIYDELGTCRERYSDNTMHGYLEVEAELRLFADTREALELKAEVLTTEEG